jgi:gas vesicle structural protein
MSATHDEAREVTLLELVDRLLDRGVVLTGDITISVADVDLIVLGLRLLLASAERMPAGGAGVVLSQPASIEAPHD